MALLVRALLQWQAADPAYPGRFLIEADLETWR
jgi:hypothetical protein